MGCDSNLFLKSGVNTLKLVKYIELKYGQYGKVSYGEDRDFNYFDIFFNDGVDNRRLFVLIHGDDDDCDRPVPIIPNVSCTFILGLWKNSVEILQDIAKHFGGGYVRNNDCGDDGSEEWYFVNGINNDTIYITTTREDEIFKFVYNALKNEKADLNKIELTRFLINHIEEIKHL